MSYTDQGRQSHDEIAALKAALAKREAQVRELEATVMRLDGELLDSAGRIADLEEAAAAAKSYYLATGTAEEIDAHNALVETFEARKRNLNNTVTVAELQAKGIRP
jgi:predicted  nucleic acid-binding Zn-ribbon protein